MIHRKTIILFWILGTNVLAQSALEVRVTGGSALPIPNAALSVARGSIEKRGQTDSSGRFELIALTAGEYQVTAAADGYYTAKAEIAIRPRQPVRVDIRLIERKMLSQTVEVRSADISQGESSTSRLLTHPELTALPGTITADIPTLALYTFPGATLSHDNFVHVRGNEIFLQEAINGVSFLENPQEQFSVGLMPDSFETIDMLSGSFAAEYGNRFGGIVDMSTRSGFDLLGHGTIEGGVGSYDRNDTFIEYGGTLLMLRQEMRGSVLQLSSQLRLGM